MNNAEPLWSRTDFILADLVDTAAVNTWVLANRDVAKRNRTPYPEPYPRPGLESKSAKKQVTAADLIAFRARTQKG